MKKRTAFYLVLILCLVASALLSACITNPDPEDIPIDPPSEPPDNPPPNPPPPPSGSSELSARAEALSMETIAYMVLRGDYGPELRALLADEVSVIVSEMAEAGMMSIFVDDNGTGVMLLESERKPVPYDDSYLVASILAGTYGSMARTNLHAFARSFENEVIIPWR